MQSYLAPKEVKFLKPKEVWVPLTKADLDALINALEHTKKRTVIWYKNDEDVLLRLREWKRISFK